MGPVIMACSDLHSSDGISESEIQFWQFSFLVIYIYDFIYILNISRMYCHFTETRMVPELSDLPKNHMIKPRLKIPDFRTSSALGYNLVFPW